MGLFTEKPEDKITYADTVIKQIEHDENEIRAVIECYYQEQAELKFVNGRLLALSDDLPERVESTQIIKLKNKNKRLIVFDDDLGIILELEYSQCVQVCD